MTVTRTRPASAMAALAAILALLAGCDSATSGPGPDGGFDGGFVGVKHCKTDTDCDDGLACTSDSCIDAEGQGRICAWTVSAGNCVADSRCFADGAANPANACERCDAKTPSGWVTAADGSACDDGDPCTFNMACKAGVCAGEQVDCDDGNICTADSCAPGLGCANTATKNGEACDDADACTTDTRCVAGACAGTPLSCNDGDPCTDDECDPATGCNNPLNSDPCDDGDPCTTGEVCAAGVCGGGTPETCDDGNACTIDFCDAVAGCQHLPTSSPCCIGNTSICDDGDPCTTDLCDPATSGCSYEPSTATCDDGSACTENDSCSAGVCAGSPVSCDDGNDCTVDACNAAVGCYSTKLASGPCSDGLSCSTGDTCVAGVCQADTSSCLCTPTFEDAAKATSLAVGANESAGQALDVDGDTTLDNALAPIGTFVNTPLQDGVTAGSLMMLFEYLGFAPGSFTLALLTAELDPANSSCDFQTATCNYYAERGGLDPTSCAPKVTLPATRNGNLVTAGGPGTTLPLSIPLDAQNTLDLTLYKVKVQMTVTLANQQVVAFDALIGGAVTETDLTAAIMALDPASLPVAPDALVSMIGILAPNDIDSDGDGTPDAKSIGLKVSGIDGKLTGAVP